MECQNHRRPSIPRSCTPWRTRAVAKGQVLGGAECAGRDQAGGGRWRLRGHRGRAPSRPAPRHGPARPAALPAVSAAAGALRAAHPAAGKDPHRHRLRSPKVRSPGIAASPAPEGSWGWGGQVRRPPAGARSKGKTTGGMLGLGRRRFAEPRHPDRGSADRRALVVPWRT